MADARTTALFLEALRRNGGQVGALPTPFSIVPEGSPQGAWPRPLDRAVAPSVRATPPRSNPIPSPRSPSPSPRRRIDIGQPLGSSDYLAPQGADESNWMAGGRQTFGRAAVGAAQTAFDPAYNPMISAQDAAERIAREAGAAIVSPVLQAFRYAGDTPRAQAARAAAPMNSYKDERWGALEQAAEAKYGLPAGTLAAIRLRGERSNGDQVSSAGARGVYQFIPATRDGVLKQAGVDAYGSPAEQAMAAAYLHKQNLDRHGGSPAAAFAAYNGGNAAGSAVAAGRMPPATETQAYLQRVLGGVRELGGLGNPFDPSYGNAALADIDAATRSALAPQTISYDTSAAPEMPALQTVAPRDFSAADAAIAALKPEEISEKEALRTRRSGWMAGIGQALAGLEDGAGLGRVLAALGGGAAMGAAKGDQELRAREDRQDELMAQYNVALANQETMKANALHQDLQHNADAQNAYALDKWKVATDRFYKENFGTVQGDSFIVSKSDGKGGVKMTRTPIAGAVMADMAVRKASVHSQMFSAQNSANAQVMDRRNSLIVGAAATAASMVSAPPEDQAAGVVQGAASIAGDIVQTGRVADLFGGVEGPGYGDLQKQVQTAVQQMGMMPGADGYTEAYSRVMQERLTAAALSNPAFRKRMLETGGAAQAVVQANRRADMKTTTTRNAKGVTVREQH